MIDKKTMALIVKNYGREFALNEVRLRLDAAQKDLGLFMPINSIANSLGLVNRCADENKRLKEG